MWDCQIVGEGVRSGGSMARRLQITPDATWVLIRDAIEGGLPIPRAAERFGVKGETIKGRAKREKWASPGRVARGDVGPAPSKSKDGLTQTGSFVAQSDPNPEQLILSKLEKLRNAAGSDPKVFQELLAEIAEDKLAAAMEELDPRSVSEVARLNELIRRNRGFDAKAGAPQGFVRPLRTLTRQPALEIDITPAGPLDDFPI